MPRQPKMGERIEALEKQMGDRKSKSARKRHRRKVRRQLEITNSESRLSGKKVKYAAKEIDYGSLQNLSEQLDRKFPRQLRVTPSFTKNHTTVVDVLEENHDESNNKEDSMWKVNEASNGTEKNFNACVQSGKSEMRKSPSTKDERQRAHRVDL
ncbi:hypothetical protein L195_g014002 [Trifolium pratense]|uniref:Uncharacterized protein n=1 Tax=Trifolium pratense TaxID=57577 RepID=A0A2K3PPP0_TRIPR|nr:hypothetical protein L195_g014002 [Trifolium pratense]